MTRAATFIIAGLLCIAAGPPVTFLSPCSCHENRGQHRWSVKIDPSLPPADANAIQAVTPSEIYSWPGPDVPLTQSSEHTGIENKWFALTGRVVALKVEADGDLHIAVQDATGDKPGIVVCEVPAEPQWCEVRNTVFSWTATKFPFHKCVAQLSLLFLVLHCTGSFQSRDAERLKKSIKTCFVVESEINVLQAAQPKGNPTFAM
jgi:hypothetical protein